MRIGISSTLRAQRRLQLQPDEVFGVIEPAGARPS